LDVYVQRAPALDWNAVAKPPPGSADTLGLVPDAIPRPVVAPPVVGVQVNS
jgi:hypothetical protein